MALLVYCIHEINDNIMKKLRKIARKHPEAILTFDDALYSQYKYIDELEELPNKKIFYITAGIVNTTKKFDDEFITCAEAHAMLKWDRKKGLQYYMSWEQINDIATRKNCQLGMHGFSHLDTNAIKPSDKLDIIKEDISKMIKTFKDHLPINIDWEYNYNPPYDVEDDLYESLLILSLRKAFPDYSKFITYYKHRVYITDTKIQKISQ